MNNSIPYSPIFSLILSSSILIISAPTGLVLLDSRIFLLCVSVFLQCYSSVLHEWGPGWGFSISANWMWKQDTVTVERRTDCTHFRECTYVYVTICVTVRPDPAWVGPGVFYQCPTEIQLHKDKRSQCGHLETTFCHFHSLLPKCTQCWVFRVFAFSVLISWARFVLKLLISDLL